MPDQIQDAKVDHVAIATCVWMITIHPQYLQSYKRKLNNGSITSMEVWEALQRDLDDKDKRRLAREATECGEQDVWYNRKLMVFYNWPKSTQDSFARAVHHFMQGTPPVDPKLIIEAKK
jgi:hypothetical protein